MKRPPPPPASDPRTPLGEAADIPEVWRTCRQLPLPPPLDAASFLEVWQARLTPVSHLAESLAALLDPAECAEIDRLRQPEDRTRMRLRRGLRRLLLARRLRCAPERLRFARGPGGKPALREPADALRFSTASAGDWFLLGMAPDRELGVDVEIPSRLFLSPGLLDLACSSRERARLEALPEPEQRLAFLRLWTAKEAVLKLRGTGFHASTDVRTLLENLRTGECVAELTVAPDGIAHVATDKPEENYRTRGRL